MKEATVGTSPGLPEGDAGRGVGLITDFPHDFYLVSGAGVWRAVGA